MPLGVRTGGCRVRSCCSPVAPYLSREPIAAHVPEVLARCGTDPRDRHGNDTGERPSPRLSILAPMDLVPGIKAFTHLWTRGMGAAIDSRHKAGDDDGVAGG